MTAQEKIVIPAFERAKKETSTLSYKATLLTKKFGRNDFKTKRFEVFARRNEGQNDYRFDWEIIERMDGGEQIFIFLGKEFFYVNDFAKVIGYERNISKLENGEYFEAMRSFVLIDELLFELDSLYPSNDVHVNQSLNRKVIVIRLNKDGSQIKKIFLNQETSFPDSVLYVVENKETQLTQIIKTVITDVKTNIEFSDTILNPQHYLNKEYKIKLRDVQSDEESNVVSHFVSEEQLESLLDAQLIDAKGGTVRLREVEGQFILLDFWYASCVPCLKALPRINELSRKFENKGLLTFGVNCVDFEDRKDVTSKLETNDFNFPFLYGRRSLLAKLGINAFPTYILLDRSKRLIYFNVGNTDELETFVNQKLE